MNLWPFHHRKKRNIAAVPQEQSGIQLQSAAAAIAIPIVYGQARVAGNLIHYKTVSSTVEALLFSQTRAMIAMAICEGPIHDVVHTWFDKQSRTKADLSTAGFVTFLGTLSQAAWSFLTTNFPAEAVPYELTAYMACPSWPLKVGASLPNYSWEVQGIAQWNLGGGIVDANPKDVVTDFLTDPHHGAMFPSAQLATLTDFRDYCTAAGIFLSPVFTSQRMAAEHLVEFLALANSGFVWSDGLLKIVPYGDTAITGNGVTYTPNVTPIYNLTDDDFIAADDEDPVRVSRTPQADAYNHIQLQFENRAKAYNLDVAEAKDQTSIEITGLRTAPVMMAPMIKDAAVARTIVQLALQRQVFIRNTYEFTLGFRYVLLDPMDLVTLTDANLGLNQTTVRITKIEEQDDGSFLFTAEEWPFGVATAALYGTPSELGYAPEVPTIANPPVVSLSFNALGQAILNLTGDKSTVKHIYVLRTDRVPTLAETQAGTVVNTQTVANIATGVTVAGGANVYVGALSYNMWGDESALVTGVFPRQGIDLDALGRIKRANPFDDGKFAPRASDAAGSIVDATVTDSTGSEIRKAFHKAAFTDPDHLDSVPDGSTYSRPLATRVNAGRPLIDFAESIHSNKHLDNIADGSTFARMLANRLASGILKRAGALDDGSYALKATETDGSTKSSSALAPQGSVIPAPMAALPFNYAAGGAGSSAMWIALSWSAITLYKPDGTTIVIPASSSLATPPSPTLSQVLAGALGARTRFARIGYAKNGMIYRVGAEDSFAISANNVLKITSPGSVAGYDGWIPMVGSATNAEKVQSVTIPFGTDWTEPVGGFDTTGTAYNNTNWPNSVISTGQNVNTTYFFYPWWDLALAIVVFPDIGQTSKTAIAANEQNKDGRFGLSPGAMSVITPAGAGSGSGTGGNGGGKYL